ncbi:MAG: peptidoglycan-binding protein [Phormidesmis sp. RL_2_1]|nr:peptidoglycan-binding protein [Phormidesmis sp. RL_2_1]
MKQLAIRSLGWGAGIIAAITQLPVIARQPMPNTASIPISTSIPISSQSVSNQSSQPASQLLAVALSSRSLRVGDTGADVRALQRYLSRNGLYPFIIDGVYGQETADAVSTYQRIRDLPATGIADEATLTDMEFDFLPAAAPPASAPPASGASQAAIRSGILAPGSTGSDVIALQQRLNGLGIPVFVDGIYGFETQQAVRTYQRVQGLNVTGNADNETLQAMGFSAAASRLNYVAAVIADESRLASVRQFFPEAYVDRLRQGSFINIGNFGERLPAEARADAAAARGFSTRVLYRR